MTAIAGATESKIMTGRRANPAIDGPRDNTVCFMLSKNEKFELDRLAFCINLTRSGLLAKVVAQFIAATEDTKQGREAAKGLRGYLAECAAAVKKRGTFATKTLREMERQDNERNH
jgi:hypothetical protein